eukprot:CAMPEP_0204018008 /NCGR_PEP_ID=MMETSP0360-20130528/27795_1 /ASSEMBLY_ACC=CAM_ASM_000342 /TAXON_ID=268821 /ORGANISM="Scrippsiella Hangoei, Strain SHTV-5" /LENGTH=94 /DNA_ID=CAMNT_0050961105 /DNA_START=19 /DNA_END=300 /DNA_ORIENTATION=+
MTASPKQKHAPTAPSRAKYPWPRSSYARVLCAPRCKLLLRQLALAHSMNTSLGQWTRKSSKRLSWNSVCSCISESSSSVSSAPWARGKAQDRAS